MSEIRYLEVSWRLSGGSWDHMAPQSCPEGLQTRTQWFADRSWTTLSDHFWGPFSVHKRPRSILLAVCLMYLFETHLFSIARSTWKAQWPVQSHAELRRALDFGHNRKAN